MAVDPETVPVVVGVGRHTQRPGIAFQRALSPIDIMAHTARKAARDCEVEAILRHVDAVAVVQSATGPCTRCHSPACVCCPVGAQTTSQTRLLSARPCLQRYVRGCLRPGVRRRRSQRTGRARSLEPSAPTPPRLGAIRRTLVATLRRYLVHRATCRHRPPLATPARCSLQMLVNMIAGLIGEQEVRCALLSGCEVLATLVRQLASGLPSAQHVMPTLD